MFSCCCVQVICLDDEKKFNFDIIFCLIRSELLNVGEYNVHLAKLIDGGRNSMLMCSYLNFGYTSNLCFIVPTNN
jgi:hypothetical protein